jgi:hypothetical protein
MLKYKSYLLILYINIIFAKMNDINEKIKNRYSFELYGCKKLSGIIKTKIFFDVLFIIFLIIFLFISL